MSRLWNKFKSLFIKPKYELWITYQPTTAWESKKETHKFIVRKKMKITPKHIIFLDNDERVVEIKSQEPIDYMIRELYE
tara:strand:+ start:238 stop:474 length:237 start_codon:yes stop_codon:yes gene_type:complete